MARVHAERFSIQVPQYKQVPIDPPATGYASVRIEDLVAEVIVEVDLERIARHMGSRAVRSKTGRCVDGFVVVKHDRKKK
jgi:hypothetical protein